MHVGGHAARVLMRAALCLVFGSAVLFNDCLCWFFRGFSYATGASYAYYADITSGSQPVISPGPACSNKVDKINGVSRFRELAVWSEFPMQTYFTAPQHCFLGMCSTSSRCLKSPAIIVSGFQACAKIWTKGRSEGLASSLQLLKHALAHVNLHRPWMPGDAHIAAD
jgi:hypothetical protein